MSIEYPSSWRELKFPAMRAELIQYLSEIVSALPGSDPAYKDFDIDEVAHFFFDDTDLSEEHKFVAGEMLFDDAEKFAILRVTTSIGFLISELGNAMSKAYLSHPGWSEVKRCAADALLKIRERGVPTIRS
jgi:hypothetical protein